LASLFQRNGLSPSSHTVAPRGCHGSVGIFLVNAHSKKNLGALQEVAEFFDTAPAAFHAAWAPDSAAVGPFGIGYTAT